MESCILPLSRCLYGGGVFHESIIAVFLGRFRWRWQFLVSAVAPPRGVR